MSWECVLVVHRAPCVVLAARDVRTNCHISATNRQLTTTCSFVAILVLLSGTDKCVTELSEVSSPAFPAAFAPAV